MATPYPTGASASNLRPSIDFKANGEASRMRSHKGNMPSLPQTKFCSLCPAKFTRTTHLNRHLRSHTNERSHRCEVCSAEFTRSDLLTRHKRTCGDSRNSNRSRRKSCQACAESKVKCDLQLPCSKCTARGRECVFINDPEASRNRKAARRNRSISDGDGISEGSTFGDLKQPRIVKSPMTYSTVYPSPVSLASDTLPDSLASSPTSASHSDIQIPYTVPGLSQSSSSSSSSCSSSSRHDSFDMLPNMTAYSFDPLEAECQFNDFFPLTTNQSSNDPPYLSDLLSSTDPSHSHSHPFSSGSSCSSAHIYGGVQGEMSYHPQDLIHGYPSMSSPVYSAPSESSMHHFGRSMSVLDGPLSPLYQDSSVLTMPSNTDSEAGARYLQSFFELFSTQIPLIHNATWTSEDKHPMLINAMQACGALYVKTQRAEAFVERTLEYLGENLIAEFSKPDCPLKDQFSIIMAVVLLQSWNLLDRQPDRHGTSRLFHGVVVTMIRRIGLIRLLSDWTPPDLSNPYTLEAAWHEWSRFETLKRVVFFAYVQDCANSAYFAMAPVFHPSEIEIALPCDDSLWTASTVKEWYQMLQTPSQYAVGPRHIPSVNMRRALVSLDNPGPLGMPLHVNPFSHMILIHTIIRNIFASGFDDAYSENPARAQTGAPLADAAASTRSKNLSNQYALHNWLEMWRANPDAIILEKAGFEATPVFCAAAPFYWLAHYSLQAAREGVLDLSPAATEEESQERCILIDSWMQRIQAYLRQRVPMPPRVQDLMSAGKELEASSAPLIPVAMSQMLDRK